MFGQFLIVSLPIVIIYPCLDSFSSIFVLTRYIIHNETLPFSFTIHCPIFEAKTFETPISTRLIAEKSRRCQERPRNRKHLLNHQPPQKRSQRNQWTQRMKILREIGKSSIVVRVGWLLGLVGRWIGLVDWWIGLVEWWIWLIDWWIGFING